MTWEIRSWGQAVSCNAVGIMFPCWIIKYFELEESLSSQINNLLHVHLIPILMMTVVLRTVLTASVAVILRAYAARVLISRWTCHVDAFGGRGTGGDSAIVL